MIGGSPVSPSWKGSDPWKYETPGPGPCTRTPHSQVDLTPTGSTTTPILGPFSDPATRPPTFSPTPSWDLLPSGALVSGDGGGATLKITDRSGTLVREVSVRQGDPIPIPEQERRDSLAALRVRLDSVPDPLDQVIGMPAEVRDLRLPETLPEVLSLHVDTVGRIWVRRWPRPGEGTRYDVFTADGEVVGAIHLPAKVHPRTAPWIGQDRIVLVDVEEVYGVERLAVFTFAL